ncbi:leucyl aminopeptidase [Dokdonella sp.]|uniref:leucyl aminopeptidase n=1 Tax=Dokdonella sp. TaxID=2291710 RepID=UPI001B1736ED|nr:leucyl aminopeptidase [Dokdonella sp.]MBO9665143.1 leucyl aminopeptidase [Dokdonella sp.]
MTLKFSTTADAPETAAAPCLVVGLYEDRTLSSAAARVDERSGGAIKRLIDSGDATGKLGSTTLLFGLAGIAAPRVLVVGLGEQKKFDAAAFHRAANDAGRALKNLPVDAAASYLTELDVPGRDLAWKLRTAALAADAQAYRYTATFKPKEASKAPQLGAIAFAAAAGTADRALNEAAAIASGVRFARELGNLPPNICNPAYLAAQAQQLADAHAGVSLSVLEREDMAKLGMGSLLGVAQGSANPPKLIVLQWKGGGDARPYALVGKGITFDTGGISIKPGAGMEEMKFDMCGAAGVLGTFLAAVELKLPINLLCIVPAVENMPDGNAYRPSDILTSLSGLTIEVLNTDAEGRLILCDALTYAQSFDPQVIIDAATLTGACVVALGKHASGLMSKDDELAEQLLAAGSVTHDRAWRLPLWDDYQSQLDSGFADVANIGGKYAGAITAGCFLSRFVNGRRWAHLDIAGTAWEEGRKGLATGRPVPLLTQYLIDRSA